MLPAKRGFFIVFEGECCAQHALTQNDASPFTVMDSEVAGQLF